MKKEKIKALSFVIELADYFERRAKRVLKLKLKDGDYDHVSIDIHPDRGTVWVWLHGVDKIIGRAHFTFDGRCQDKLDCRLDDEEKK